MIGHAHDRPRSNDFSDHTVLVKTGRFLETDLDDEIVLMDRYDGAFFSFSETARDCWHLITQGATFCTIIARLSLQYDVDEEMCREDVSRFINDLINCKFVRAYGL